MEDQEITITNIMPDEERRYLFNYYFLTKSTRAIFALIICTGLLGLFFSYIERNQLDSCLQNLGIFILAFFGCIFGYFSFKHVVNYQINKYQNLVIKSDSIYVEKYRLDYDVNIVLSKNFLILTNRCANIVEAVKMKGMRGIVIFHIPQNMREEVISLIEYSPYVNFEIMDSPFDLIYFRKKGKFKN